MLLLGYRRSIKGSGMHFPFSSTDWYFCHIYLLSKKLVLNVYISGCRFNLKNFPKSCTRGSGFYSSSHCRLAWLVYPFWTPDSFNNLGIRMERKLSNTSLWTGVSPLCSTDLGNSNKHDYWIYCNDLFHLIALLHHVSFSMKFDMLK